MVLMHLLHARGLGHQLKEKGKKRESIINKKREREAPKAKESSIKNTNSNSRAKVAKELRNIPIQLLFSELDLFTT